MHNPICECGECVCARLNGAAPTGGNPAVAGAGARLTGAAVRDPSLPQAALLMEIIGAVTIRNGTVHALLLWDGANAWVIFWERSANDWRGEWGLEKLAELPQAE